MATYKSATKSCIIMNKMNLSSDIIEIIKSYAYNETEKCVKQSKTQILSIISTMWEYMDADDIESYSGVNDGWWVKHINSIMGTYIKGTYIKDVLQFKENATICFNSKNCLKCGNYREPVYIYSECNIYPCNVLTIENAPHLICRCRLSMIM